MGAASHVDRNRWLDALRGIAIVQVLIWHMIAPLAQKRVPVAGRALSLTWSGVDLFFVLSGFLIGGILLRNRGADNYFRVFYARRVLRILPLYLVALAVFFAVYPEPFEWYYLPLFQNFVWAAQDRFGPGAIALTWSLAVEEQFYLCLPLIVALTPRRWFPWLVFGLACAAPLFRIACHYAGSPHAAYLLLPGRMDALLIGVLIAWLQIEGRLDRAARIAAFAVVPLGIAFAAMAMAQVSQIDPVMGTLGYSVIAIFYGAVLVLVATRSRSLPMWLSPLAWAGLGAYSLYLFHQMIENAALHWLGVTPLALAVTLVGLIVVPIICWKLAEAPLIAFGHRRFRYWRPAEEHEMGAGNDAAPVGAAQ